MAVAPESWCWIQAEGSKFKLNEESGPLKIWLWPNGCLQSLRMFSFISLSSVRYVLVSTFWEKSVKFDSLKIDSGTRDFKCVFKSTLSCLFNSNEVVFF